MDEMTIYDKYPDDLLHLDQVKLKKEFDKDYTLEEMHEVYKDHFNEDLGDGIAFRISNEEGEIIYEEDCKEVVEGSINFLKTIEKDKLVTKLHLHSNYYQNADLIKPCLEIVIENKRREK